VNPLSFFQRRDQNGEDPYLIAPAALAYVVGAALILAGLFMSGRQNKIAPAAHLVPATAAHSAKEIVHGDTSKKQIIFTFDGGDGHQSADQILAVLAKHHVTGTFFLTGKFVEANPALVNRMVAAGHEIMSHTYSHPFLTSLTDAQIGSELQRMAQSLKTVAGIAPLPYFRAPYGDRDERVRHDAFLAGYESVYWTVDARDWQESQGETADQVKEIILDSAAPGTIYLMHLGDTITGSILDEVMTTLEARGYKLVSLTQGL
jgi:peptidoglycan-N-acetylmuramic acid deacetylase